MKKFLMLASIVSIVWATEESAIPAGAVQCGKGRYRFEPYDQNIIQTPGAAQNPQHSTSHVGLEPPSYTASLFPENHPLFSTLVQGKDPGRLPLTESTDLSIFKLTVEMAQVPGVMKNFAQYILPQLRDFATKRFQGSASKRMPFLNKQVQSYDALAYFYILMGEHVEAIYMITGIANIYGMQGKNEEAFNLLHNWMGYIQQYLSAEDSGAKRTRGNVFLMMVKYLYHMEPEARARYKSILDRHKDLCEKHLIENMLNSKQQAWLSALGYRARRGVMKKKNRILYACNLSR